MGSSLLCALLLSGARASSKICDSGTLQPAEVINPAAASGSRSMVVRAWWAGPSLCCHPAGVVPDAFKRIVAQGKNVLCTALGGCGAQEISCRTAAKELGTGHLLVWQVQGAAGRPVTPERSGHLHHLAGDDCTCTCRSGPACRLLQLHMTAFWHGSAQGST